MHKLQEIIVILVVLVVLGYLYDKYSRKHTEGFRNDTQNWLYTNKFEVADRLEYPNANVSGMYQGKVPEIFAASMDSGVNENSKTDVFDERGFKWTKNASNPEVDELTYQIDNQQLRQNFERTYLLDPEGSVAQYDITNNTISPNCCPAQYSPPFKLTDKNESNCDYAQKYVANNYSGMNFKDGYGCVCMTPKQASFYGNRGGNTE
jgi:hypothetical protein